MKTIVNASLFQNLKDKQLTIISSCVYGRLCTRSGSTYNSYSLQVKCSDGNIYNLAKGFMKYGYGRDYEDRANKVLGLINNDLRVDFSTKEDVKQKDMFNIKHYSDDLKCGWYLDITDLV